MIFRQLFDRESCTYTYLVADDGTREAALVDTVRENVERDLALVAELGLTLVHVLETHVHADHVTGAGELRRRTGCKTHVARQGGAPCADDALEAGAVVTVGRVQLRALATPGHTGGCMAYLVGEGERFDRVLTGDALLVRGCGRTDFQEGSAETLYRSIKETLYALPPETLVYPGHDYRGMTMSTIGEERHHNPRINETTTVAQFVATMAALKLPPPAKIDIAVAANRACGDAPERVPQG